MSERSKAAPQPEQVARADRLRETISNLKRGVRPEPKSPRDVTERAADEAARNDKLTGR